MRWICGPLYCHNQNALTNIWITFEPYIVSRLMNPLFCIIQVWEIDWNGYFTHSKLLYMLKWHFNAIFCSKYDNLEKWVVNIPIFKVYAETQHVPNGYRKLPTILSFDLSGNMWLYVLRYSQKHMITWASALKLSHGYEVGGLACWKTKVCYRNGGQPIPILNCL